MSKMSLQEMATAIQDTLHDHERRIAAMEEKNRVPVEGEECTCEHGGGSIDTCPYDEELNPDFDPSNTCNCCDYCRYQCGQDI